MHFMDYERLLLIIISNRRIIVIKKKIKLKRSTHLNLFSQANSKRIYIL